MPNARRVIAAIAILGALATLVGLGSWQLARRAEKHALMAHIAARMTAPPVALPAAIPDPRAFDYRRVTVTGRYLHGREMRLLNRVVNGAAGTHVITPLVREDGPTVLIDRGWVPHGFKPDDPRGLAMPTGRVTVTGIARVPVPPGPFVPANEPGRGLWFSLDISAMAAAKSLGALAPVVVWADAAPGGPWTFPLGGQARLELRDDHLQYALTWYSLAIVLVVIVLVAARRRRSPGQEA